MATSPTAHTLAECRRRGWLATVVEKWVPQARKRIDAFGFGDVLVLDDQPGALLIQATSASNVSSRVQKIRGECKNEAAWWLSRGNRIQVWGWGKRGKAGERKVWQLRTVDVTEV